MKYLLLLTLLAGCTPKADTVLLTTSTAEGRITVRRIGVFEDELAYGDRRGIYMLRDEKTGREYLGISGIGISEMGVHPESKETVNHEQ